MSHSTSFRPTTLALLVGALFAVSSANAQIAVSPELGEKLVINQSTDTINIETNSRHQLVSIHSNNPQKIESDGALNINTTVAPDTGFSSSAGLYFDSGKESPVKQPDVTVRAKGDIQFTHNTAIDKTPILRVVAGVDQPENGRFLLESKEGSLTVDSNGMNLLHFNQIDAEIKAADKISLNVSGARQDAKGKDGGYLISHTVANGKLTDETPAGHGWLNLSAGSISMSVKDTALTQDTSLIFANSSTKDGQSGISLTGRDGIDLTAELDGTKLEPVMWGGQAIPRQVRGINADNAHVRVKTDGDFNQSLKVAGNAHVYVYGISSRASHYDLNHSIEAKNVNIVTEGANALKATGIDVVQNGSYQTTVNVDAAENLTVSTKNEQYATGVDNRGGLVNMTAGKAIVVEARGERPVGILTHGDGRETHLKAKDVTVSSRAIDGSEVKGDGLSASQAGLITIEADKALLEGKYAIRVMENNAKVKVDALETTVNGNIFATNHGLVEINGNTADISGTFYTQNNSHSTVNVDAVTTGGINVFGHSDLKVTGNVVNKGTTTIDYSALAIKGSADIAKGMGTNHESSVDVEGKTFKVAGNTVTQNKSRVTVKADTIDLDSVYNYSGSRTELTGNTTVNGIFQNASSALKLSGTTKVNGNLTFMNKSTLELDPNAPLTEVTVIASETKEDDKLDVWHSSAMAILGSDIDWGDARVTLAAGSPDYKAGEKAIAAALRAEASGKVAMKDAVIAGDIVAAGKDSAVKIGSAAGSGDVYALNDAGVQMGLDEGHAWEGSMNDFFYAAEDMGIKANATDYKGNDIAVTSGGNIDLTLAGGTWTARGMNTVNRLAFTEKGGRVDMTKDADSALMVDRLEGDATIRMGFNGLDRTQSDMLYIRDFSAGSAVRIEAVLQGGTTADDLDDLRFATTLPPSPVAGGEEKDAIFEVVEVRDQGYFDIDYTVEQEKYEVGDEDNAVYNEGALKPGSELADSLFAGDQAGLNWYLKRATHGPSDEAKVIDGNARSDYWAIVGAMDLDRLNKRLGDVRYADKADDGVWVRANYSTMGTDAGLADVDINQAMLQVGWDRAKYEADGVHRTGLAFAYTQGDVDYDVASASGDLSRYDVTGYATWTANSGLYIDTLVKLGTGKNEFDFLAKSGERIKGDYDQNFLGLSLEAGKLYQKPESKVFFEPQAQLVWTMLEGVDYRTSNGVSVDRDSINSVISRVGFRLGQKFGENDLSSAYVKADWMHEWYGVEDMTVTDVTTGPDGYRTRIDNKGDWFDVGVGVQAPMSKSTYFFVDTEYKIGNDLDDAWAVNAGARYVW